MSNPVLSIIVPSYNTSRFAPLYSDIYKIEELRGKIEILFIDDGSTDETLAVLTALADGDPDFFKVYHKENGGHGSTINYGVGVARGTFFKVVDGDDSLKKEGLIALVSALEKTTCDAVITDFEQVYLNDGSRERIVCGNISTSANDEPALDQLYLKFHSLTYRTAFWKEHAFSLDEKVFYEDQEYVVFPIPYIKTWIYLHYVVYEYNLGVAGQSVSANSFRKHFADHRKVALAIIDWYKNHYDLPDVQNRKALLKYASICIGLHLEMILLVSEPGEAKQNLKEFDSLFLRNVRELRKKAMRATKSMRVISLFNYFFANFVQEPMKRRKGFVD